jgi:hypothetical protein
LSVSSGGSSGSGRPRAAIMSMSAL